MREPEYTQKPNYRIRGAILDDAMVRRICHVWRNRPPKRRLSERKLSEAFGVSRSCINHIVSGRSWQHITLPMLFGKKVP